MVRTMFGKEIPADQSHALNYIIQSTTAELVLQQVIKIDKMLESMNTFIAFTIHDNVVLDMPFEERYNIPMLVEEFSNTGLGKFLVNVKAGTNFGNLRTLNI